MNYSEKSLECTPRLETGKHFCSVSWCGCYFARLKSCVTEACDLDRIQSLHEYEYVLGQLWFRCHIARSDLQNIKAKDLEYCMSHFFTVPLLSTLLVKCRFWGFPSFSPRPFVNPFQVTWRLDCSNDPWMDWEIRNESKWSNAPNGGIEYTNVYIYAYIWHRKLFIDACPICTVDSSIDQTRQDKIEYK